MTGMQPVPVYFSPITSSSESISVTAGRLITKLGIAWEKHLPIKIHPGAIGNTSFIPADYYSGILSVLQTAGVNPYYIETCMASQTSAGKEREFVEHGFTQLPYVIADGVHGDDDIMVPIQNSKHFSSCLIAKGLAEQKTNLSGESF